MDQTVSDEIQRTIGDEQLAKATETLIEYHNGKTSLEERIKANERWYKLRHWEYIRKKASQDEVEPTSAWLFNSLANKHADAMDNYPEPNVLPREQGDEEDAKMLSKIVPVILERCGFEAVYSNAWWYKLKQGCSAYGIVWDRTKMNGLGDIVVRKLDLLNLFWQPGITDIQDSPNLFLVTAIDKEAFRAAHPDAPEGITTSLTVSDYIHDESISNDGKIVQVDWYYKRQTQDGRTLLHYCQYVGNYVIYASEDDPACAETGFYAHGLYPVDFDVLFPEEDMPTGVGYVDIMKDPQMYIDKLDQIIIKNALLIGKSRWWANDAANVNMEEFTDLSKDIVHVSGGADDRNLREITVNPLPAFIVNHKQTKIDELKETSGNRDFTQGGTSGGVTAASAISALQEAGNKLSRDMIKASYRSYSRICYMVIELIRQFYDEARCFRIIGEGGAAEYIQYSNANIRQQPMPMAYAGQQQGYRVPVFDISVKPQRSNPFTSNAQNEMALTLYNSGFFNPANAQMALACLELMTFEGKQKMMQLISQHGQMYQQIMMMAAQQQQVQGTEKVAGSSSQQAASDNAKTSYAQKMADKSTPKVNA